MAAIIFDFDGTIANSFNFVADFLTSEVGRKPLSSEQKRQLRGLSMPAMARRLGYHSWQLPGLFLRGRREIQQAPPHFRPFDRMPEVIRKLHSEGHELFVVSSNTVPNIRFFLRSHGLRTLFLQIYGGVQLFGKAPVLKRLIREHQLELGNCVYVGDELRDVEAAQSVGIKVIAVTWGFAKSDDLKSLNPTATADSPADLISILENW